MRIALYDDEQCTELADFQIDILESYSSLRTASVSPSSHTVTIGEKSYKYWTSTFIINQADLSDDNLPRYIWAQVTDDYNRDFYFKPAGLFRLHVTCTRVQDVENTYRYAIWIQYKDGSTWRAIEGAAAATPPSGYRELNQVYNFTAFNFNYQKDGKDYVFLGWLQLASSSLRRYQLHGLIIEPTIFDGSPAPAPEPTKSETPTSSPSGHFGTGRTTKGNQDFVHYAQALNVVNTGAHGLRMYEVGTGAIEAIYDRLWSRDIWDVWANRKFNPIGGLLSLHRVPCAAPTAAAVSSVTIAGQQYPVPASSAKIVSDNIVTVQCNGGNWLDVPEIAGSFVDYAPYCSAVLTLPFIGSVGIDVNAFSSGKIKVVYEIDLISGNCLAEVFTLDRDGSSILYGSYAGNCAYKMPITGNDNGGLAVLGAVAGIATTGLATVATGGSAAPLAASVISGAANAIGAEHHLQQAGTLPSNASAIGDLRVTLVITRPAYLTPDDYEQIKGYPAGDGHIISQYSGFLAGEMHAEGIDGATDAEKAAIEAAFAGGVYV